MRRASMMPLVPHVSLKINLQLKLETEKLIFQSLTLNIQGSTNK